MAFATVRVLTLENILKDDLCIWQLQVKYFHLPEVAKYIDHL